MTQTVLTGALERKLRHEQLADNIANRNYQGVFEGPEDTVKVTIAQSGSVSDYTGGSITIEENVDATPRLIVPDHKKAFGFVLDGSENLEQYAEGFAEETFAKVLEEADKYILQNASTAGNNFAYDQATDSVTDLFGEAREILDDNAVPQAQRFAVVPSSVAREVYDDLSQRETGLGDNSLQTGLVGSYYGFQVYSRPTDFFQTGGGGAVETMFGSRFYQTYADAVVSLQVFERAQNYPAGTLIQGLHVAGSIVTQPDSMVRADVTEA
jgi:hypothetical protein